MRLGTKKYVNMRTQMHPKKVTFCLLCLCFLAFLFFSGMYFFEIIRPVMIRLAENRAEVLAEQAVATACADIFDRITYADFITVSRLENGFVGSLEANLSGMNRLRAQATNAIQNELNRMTETELSVPLGTLTGYDLFAGLGPRLPVRLMPHGRTVVAFKSDFTESGINQTRLEVSLEAKTTVGIILPTKQISREISTVLPVLQTVILGDVPENYVNIDRMGEQYEDDVLDIIG